SPFSPSSPPPPLPPPPFPYTTLFRSHHEVARQPAHRAERLLSAEPQPLPLRCVGRGAHRPRPVAPEDLRHGRRVGLDRGGDPPRSEEHTSELQSRVDLVCRLLLEKKK